MTFQTKFGGEVVRETSGVADENGVAVARVWGESGPREGFLGKYAVIAKFNESELTGQFEVVDDIAKPGDKGDQGDNGKDDESGNKGKNVLPRTGTSALAATGVAIGMIAVGGGLIAASRRRKA